MTFHVWVPGNPVSQGSKRLLQGRIVESSSKTLRPWRRAISQACRTDVQLGGPLSVRLLFVIRPPLRARDKHGNLRPGWLWHDRRPDIDKLSRAVLDALTDAGVYSDDAQVVLLTVGKMWGIDSGVQIDVASAPEMRDTCITTSGLPTHETLPCAGGL